MRPTIFRKMLSRFSHIPWLLLLHFLSTLPSSLLQQPQQPFGQPFGRQILSQPFGQTFSSQQDVTKQCLDQAHFRDCAVFTHCCGRQCPQGQGHKCMAFLGMIDQGQSSCDCAATPLSSTPAQFGQFGQQGNQQQGQNQQQNQWGHQPAAGQPTQQQQPAAASQWPSAGFFGAGGQSQITAGGRWPSFQLTSTSPSPPSPNRRPPPPAASDPSSLRSLFQSGSGIGMASSSAAGSGSRLQRIGRCMNGGCGWWAELGRKADFVGAVLSLFVLDLLLLSLTL